MKQQYKTSIFKHYLVVAVFFSALPASYAQQSFPTDPNAMMQLQQKAMEAQACFKGISEEDINALQAKGQAFEKTLKKLCAEGKRSEAQSKAMQFSAEFTNNKTLKTLQKCSEGLSGMMESMMPPLPENKFEDLQDQHVCDGI